MSIYAEGGCICHAIRYAVKSDPVYVINCGCSFCQRATGGHYLVEAMFPREDLEVMSGVPKANPREAASQFISTFVRTAERNYSRILSAMITSAACFLAHSTTPTGFRDPPKQPSTSSWAKCLTVWSSRLDSMCIMVIRLSWTGRTTPLSASTTRPKFPLTFVKKRWSSHGEMERHS